mgnify:CR=1 FL=1
MSNTPQLEKNFARLGVGCTHRVYVMFTSDYIPLWTELLRFILRLKQGTKVTHTHVLVAVQHTEDSVLSLYEMEYDKGMNEYALQYDAAYFSENTLEVHQEQYNGVMQVIKWHALDVTPYIQTPTLIPHRFYDAFTDVPLTPWTLLTHITPANNNKETWTCTGLVQVLMGYDKPMAFNNPLTPDQLHDTLSLVLQNY